MFKEITLLFSLLICGSNKLTFSKHSLRLLLEMKIAKTSLLYVLSYDSLLNLNPDSIETFSSLLSIRISDDVVLFY